MSIESDLQARTRIAGQAPFILGALGLSLLLLSQITTQTEWIADADSLAAQPRFWPGVALALMVGGFALHLLRMRRRRPDRLDWVEVRRWLEPLEYVLWFMAFVYLVPIVGFLPMSILFGCALVWRLGYRGAGYYWTAILFAVGMVTLFKGLLGVKIPGASLYEVLPGALRSFFILYL
ncbi:Tripartite tricarboxylate transporter TctB family protein [Sulfitobacter sp. THAF37]|uniref:tripartite tricarboxylate transporter TctB family protein n=1 Tax=Sulfitobacter sp. THAF37 TaxID=2587855 RepID=UPI0012697B16|nr:tripartite tricarboxylate transporter TctB family protein [Sulfitobacter sp. THAF37]QFT59573.1 Tripartite tricarboxylate transporter TctB family protein [Sulfitobacter sp. THAF37]